jgi:integrase
MLKLVKRQGSPCWQIVGTDPYTRERIRKSTGVDREDQAKNILAAYLSRAHNEAVHGPQSQTLVAEAVLEHVSKQHEARFLGPILDHLGKRKLSEITDTDLSALARKVYPDAKASTLVRQLYGPFQAVWNSAERAKMVPPRSFAKPKIKKTPARYADDRWLVKVLMALTTLEQRAAILFMSFSGARASEVVAITCGNHDPDAATVLLENTKNGEARLVPLPAFVNDALRLLDHKDPDAPLFGYTQRFALNNMLKRACARAGIEYLSPHKAGRHAFAARLLKDGNSLKALQEAGGWKSSAVVANTYAHLERAQVDRAVRGVSTIIDTQMTQLPVVNLKKAAKH